MSLRLVNGILVASAAMVRRDDEEVPSARSMGMRGDEGEEVSER
jgi:hypothetical protein